MLRQRNCPLDTEPNCVPTGRKQKKKKDMDNPIRVKRLTRLGLKKKLASLKNQSEFLPNGFNKYNRELEISSESIKLGNPAHKILFLHLLGLTPQKDIIMAPYVKLTALTTPELLLNKENSSPPELVIQTQVSGELPTTCLPNISPSSLSPTPSITDSDTSSNFSQDNENLKCFDYVESLESLDLDLEIMFCPLDFPEVYEEITGKPFSSYTSVFNTPSSTHDSRSCESGYDSNFSSPDEEKSQHNQCAKFPVRSNLMRVFGC